VREIDLYRRALRELAQQSAGRFRGNLMTRLGEVADAGAEAEILKLPDDIDHLDAMQSATGAWYFMVDVSAIDGPDPIR